MQLKWPLVLLLLVPLVAFFVVRLRRPTKRPVRPMAETVGVQHLPSYAKVRRRAQVFKTLQQTALFMLMAVLVVIIARPQESIQKVDYNNTRDIVMCLDTSSSMKEYLPGALTAMRDIVKANPTDRYALVVFQNTSFAALPLTSDVAAITLKTDELSKAYSSSALSPITSLGFNTSSDSGTDIGAGLAGCVRRFNDLDQMRSRHIIMLSDMLHNAKTDPTTVAELLPKFGIKLYILAPQLTIAEAKSSEVTQITDASVGTLDDAGDSQKVVNDIFQTILNQQATVQYVLVDAPYPWWIAAICAAAAWGVLQMIRWRRTV